MAIIQIGTLSGHFAEEDALGRCFPRHRACGSKRLRMMVFPGSSGSIRYSSCGKPRSCQHHAERLDASYRQEGHRELIKMH